MYSKFWKRWSIATEDIAAVCLQPPFTHLSPNFAGCCYVLHSTAQLYSHKRKHERREFENLYRTFRQAQRPQQIQSAAAVAAAAQLGQLQQDPSRPLASTVASLPTSAVPMAPKVNLASLPLQGYGEPLVAQTVMASQLMQPLPMPIKLDTGAAAVLAPNVSVASASTTTVAQPLALITTPSASHSTSTTSSSNNNNNSSSSSSSNGNNSTLTPAALQIKQEPKSDTESDAESKSLTKTMGTSTLPFTMATKLENVKDENLNSSLTLPIPVQQAAKMEPLEPGTQGVLKTLSDAAAALDSSGKKGLLTVAPFPRVKRVGAPEKRERDETWKNYLIRWALQLVVCLIPMVRYPHPPPVFCLFLCARPFETIPFGFVQRLTLACLRVPIFLRPLFSNEIMVIIKWGFHSN